MTIAATALARFDVGWLGWLCGGQQQRAQLTRSLTHSGGAKFVFNEYLCGLLIVIVYLFAGSSDNTRLREALREKNGRCRLSCRLSKERQITVISSAPGTCGSNIRVEGAGGKNARRCCDGFGCGDDDKTTVVPDTEPSERNSYAKWLVGWRKKKKKKMDVSIFVGDNGSSLSALCSKRE